MCGFCFDLIKSWFKIAQRVLYSTFNPLQVEINWVSASSQKKKSNSPIVLFLVLYICKSYIVRYKYTHCWYIFLIYCSFISIQYLFVEISLRAILSWYCNWYFPTIRNAKISASFDLHNNKSIIILKNHIRAYYTFQIAIIFFIVKSLV